MGGDIGGQWLLPIAWGTRLGRMVTAAIPWGFLIRWVVTAAALYTESGDCFSFPGVLDLGTVVDNWGSVAVTLDLGH